MIIGKAGDLDIQVYKGASFSQRLEFYVGDTDERIDLSGQDPWVAQITSLDGETLIADLIVDSTEANVGVLNIALESSTTLAFTTPGRYRWGLQNGGKQYVLDGIARINFKAPLS